MLAFLDVNTVWRRKFAEALARETRQSLLCAPHAWTHPAVAEPGDVALALPPGWAGALSGLAMPLLRWKLDGLARAQQTAIKTIVVTTPHYWPLVRGVSSRQNIVYYCSDDYRAYAGWDTARMIRDERAICRRATLSIFVGEALRVRAMAEYALDPARTIVSPNATEPRFAVPQPAHPEIAALPGPVFGAAGVLNRRIDLAFLGAVAADPRVGSLALVGPVEAELEGDPELQRLRAASNVHFFGRQPHGKMHAWMSSFDVAVIPYAETELNHFCSPMRLYDHRAIGHPIIATRHCAQLTEKADVLTGGASDVGELVSAVLSMLPTRRPRLETWDDRITALQKQPVAAFLFPQ